MMRALSMALVLVLAAGASAQRLEDTFAEANEAAIRGDHAAAQASYESLEEAGVLDADVAFDLATVHAQQGHYGEAIRYFERTLALRPGDPDAKTGLVGARRVLADRLAAEEGEVELAEHSSLGQALVRDLGESALAWSFVVVWLALFLALAGWRLLSGRARLVSAVATILLLAAVVGDGLLLATKRGVFRAGDPGIVVSGRARVLEGPDPRARVRHRLLEGQRVDVVGREPGYVRVRGPRGERGWVVDGEVGLVLPPDA
ncbi:MAG: tetratricopeptide repeat protein [Deltaproteobacteria bacterium]|nr:tetratricopeptide repeat protein [Deltaproteobacteria bacterium]